MVKGYIVVYKTRNDKNIYTVTSVNKDTVDLISSHGSAKYGVDPSTLREADDTEIMVGYRMEKGA
jgi:hypothetical protein